MRQPIHPNHHIEEIWLESDTFSWRRGYFMRKLFDLIRHFIPNPSNQLFIHEILDVCHNKIAKQINRIKTLELCVVRCVYSGIWDLICYTWIAGSLNADLIYVNEFIWVFWRHVLNIHIRHTYNVQGNQRYYYYYYLDKILTAHFGLSCSYDAGIARISNW